MEKLQDGDSTEAGPSSNTSILLHSSDLGPKDSKLEQVLRVNLSWSDLQYVVLVGKFRSRQPRSILQGLNGVVGAGRLLAIMGPSGCGKTSILNALAGRLPLGGKLSGAIMVNGQPRTKAFKNISAYVCQDDILFANLSVRETLQVAADLRLPSSLGKDERQHVVEGLIQELGLSKAANTRVGNEFFRGVSGGEQKRVNIGVELISNPSLIFLDEPTSGLDAFQAYNVMSSLWSLAHAGRTIVSTVHQPRSSIYNMFDLLLLMSEGKSMYFGPAKQAVDYFARLGFSCPQHYNPADFFLDIISLDYRTKEAETTSAARISLLSDAYSGSAESIQAMAVPEGSQLANVPMEFNFKTNWLWQFRVLSERAFKQAARDRVVLAFTLLQPVFVGVLLGVIYINMDMSYQGIQDRSGLLFFICIYACMGNLMSVLNTFPQEKATVNRERAAKSYRVSAYYTSKIVSEAPIRLLGTLVFSTIVYWMAGLTPHAAQFFEFWSIIVLCALAAQGLGIAISASVPNEKIAFAVAPTITLVLILFGGFFVNGDSVPSWLSWIKYISFVYYAFMGLMISNLQGQCCWECEPVCVQPDSSTGKCSQYQSDPSCSITGNTILQMSGYGSWDLWEAYLALIIALFVHNLLGYAALRFKKLRFAPLQSTAHAPSSKEQQQETELGAITNGEPLQSV